MVGRIISRYRALALLGTGGMGEVWMAEDTLLGRLVALKFLPESCSPQDRQRFFRGVRAASRLQHPEIATVYEAGEAEGRCYAGLAFVHGEPVADTIARGPVAVPEAVRIVTEAAEALGHAHEAV